MTEEEKTSTQEEFDDWTRTILGEPTTQEQLEADAKIKNLADAPEVLSYASTPKKLELPTIGYYVNYTPLTMEDRIQINSITDENPDVQRDRRNRKKAYLLLKRANPKTFTEEMINELAANIIDTILLEYDKAEDSRFLLPLMQTRFNGYRRTLRRRDTS